MKGLEHICSMGFRVISYVVVALLDTLKETDVIILSDVVGLDQVVLNSYFIT
jgi:hypothetical protein